MYKRKTPKPTNQKEEEEEKAYKYLKQSVHQILYVYTYIQTDLNKCTVPSKPLIVTQFQFKHFSFILQSCLSISLCVTSKRGSIEFTLRTWHQFLIMNFIWHGWQPKNCPSTIQSIDQSIARKAIPTKEETNFVKANHRNETSSYSFDFGIALASLAIKTINYEYFGIDRIE